MSLLPETSYLANALATKEMRDKHHQRILEAIEVLGEGIGEKIADQANMDYHAVMRRMKELQMAGKIYNTFKTSLTSTGRKANLYAIRKADTILPVPENNYMEGQVSASDYASLIIAGTKQQKIIQKGLWED